MRLPRWLTKWVPRRHFSGSNDYWIRRYRSGRDSGDGSYNELAEFKAEVLNGLVSQYGISTVIEIGCGDGNQLALADYETYLGFDISPVALALCRVRFEGDPSRNFKLTADYDGETAELCLSLDVIYHLVEDDTFDAYMQMLFTAAERYVVIYSSNTSEQAARQPPHIRHRRFSDWIDRTHPQWELVLEIPSRHPYDSNTGSGSFADFYVYQARPIAGRSPQ
ncbi:MAG: class I SAM-dependent methyltransferase [Gammaproteobacteria bacterium]|nr:class I SAM-dependent methyltransferase [Gammaproteobacteria bacterium]